MWVWVTLSTAQPQKGHSSRTWGGLGGVLGRARWGWVIETWVYFPRWLNRGRQDPRHTRHKRSQACTTHQPQLFVLFSPLLPAYPPWELSPGIWAQAGYLVPVGH